jgi:hypothetical protein
VKLQQEVKLPALLKNRFCHLQSSAHTKQTTDTNALKIGKSGVHQVPHMITKFQANWTHLTIQIILLPKLCIGKTAANKVASPNLMLH